MRRSFQILTSGLDSSTVTSSGAWLKERSRAFCKQKTDLTCQPGDLYKSNFACPRGRQLSNLDCCWGRQQPTNLTSGLDSLTVTSSGVWLKERSRALVV